MDLFEYQARDLFEAHGIPVLPAQVARTPEEARSAAKAIGGRVVIKAQVKTGGRGKAGGVKVAENPDEAFEKASAILGMDIKGHRVNAVMVAHAISTTKAIGIYEVSAARTASVAPDL